MQQLFKISFVEKQLDIIYIKIKENKYSLFSTLFCGFLAYFYMFLNKLPNQDDIFFFFEKGYTIQLGRWGLILLERIIPNYSIPWFHGILCILILSIAICCLINLFNINNKYLQILLSGIIITSSPQLETFLYMFMSSVHAIALLCSVLSLYLFNKDKLLYYFAGCLMIVFVLSLYQGFLSFIISFMIILIIQKIDNNNQQQYKTINICIKFFIFLILSIIIYILLTKLIMILFNTSFSSYASRKFYDTQHSVFEKIYSTYLDFIEFFFSGKYGLIDTKLSKTAHFFILIIFFLSIFQYIIYSKNKFYNTIIVILMIILLPLTINIWYFFNPKSPRSITLYSFNILYFIISMIVLKTFKKSYIYIYDMLIVLMFIIILSNIYYTNKKVFELQMIYKNTYAYFTQLITQVKLTPGFDKSCKLAIIGHNNNETKYNFFEFGVNHIDGLSIPLTPVDEFSEKFIKYYIGFDIEMANDLQKFILSNMTEFKSMNIYPYYGSVKKIDSFIVVKMK